MEQWDVVIVGGGAAGLMAAGGAAQAGAKVLILEKMHRVGRKLGISGKGRGNVTNDRPASDFVEHYRHGGKFLLGAFSRFFVADLLDLLERRGVPCTTERGGRIFPQSGKATDVVNALYRYARKGAAIRTEARVSDIDRHPAGFLIRTGNEAILSRRVILATGGQSYPRTGSTGDGYRFAERLGHTITTLKPSLTPLTITPLPQSIDLLLVHVGVTLWDGERRAASGFGEALLQQEVLGGAVPLDFSHLAGDLAQPTVSLDLKPALEPGKLDARLQRDLQREGKAPLRKVLDGLLPQAMIPLFLDRLRIDPNRRSAEVGRGDRLALGKLCKDFRLTVTGTRGFEEAIVTAGGVKLEEIDPRTMESRLAPGLFICGELLDIDGATGGYNLQAAFSTGFAAGQAAGTFT